jgi:uncharacterized protein (TIGR03083 family)
MADETYWAAVRSVRLQIADFLTTLSPAEWDEPSLCAGWQVRDVAGHLSCVPVIRIREMLAVAPRARFDPNRINTAVARRYGAAEPAEIIARIREHAGVVATTKFPDPRNHLFDTIVHSQDMALPLRRTFPVPVELSAAGLDRVWAMGWPFRARRRLSGLTLRATDTDWTVGTGPEVTGDALTLLLLLTGRTRTAAPILTGQGVERL